MPVHGGRRIHIMGRTRPRSGGSAGGAMDDARLAFQLYQMTHPTSTV